MKQHLVTMALFLAAGLMAGCGSSGMGGVNSTATTSVSGKVADGYLVNATVFLDKNGNYQLDAGEPSTTTDANGAYTLSIDQADVGKYPVVVLATKGVTVDKDTGSAITNSYVLSLPAAAVSGTVNSNFISPMSSQLRVLMETGNYASMRDAMGALGRQLGMPAGTDIMSDYVANGNTAMHTAAQSMATLMGSQMGQVLTTNGAATTVDVGRYQGMMVAIFRNISSVKGSGPSNQSAMTDIMATMTTTLQSAPSGQPFRNISSSIRGMMGRTGSPTGGGMMNSTSTSTMAGGMMR